MADAFEFRLLATDGMAWRGVISMPRGEVRTPAFMPVGTGGTVKAMAMDQVRALGSDIILGNTYHLMLRPGAERVARLGGLHDFARWPHPILTDPAVSGDVAGAVAQAERERGHLPIAHRRRALRDDAGALDRDPGPARSDIQMQLDECVALPAKDKDIEKAMEPSLRWAERCKTAFGDQPGKAMFGIVQGGDKPALRERSAKALSAMGLKGYAVGGLAVGEPQAVMLDMLDVTCPALPVEKPRYLMGVGTPDDILKSVARGIDMFDCVMPTRAGRHGLAFTRRGKVNLRNARHADDPCPLDEESDCPPRATTAAPICIIWSNPARPWGDAATWNNLAYYQSLMRGIRDAIEAGNFVDHSASVSEAGGGDIPAA
jgi:queuine tRNA-ribosyltransferase